MSTNGPARVFAILDLFSQARPIWTGDQISEALGYSRPSGYRYIRSLLDAGLLRKASAGVYVLGPRIVQLDYEMRQSDPVLLASREVMDELAHHSGLIVVLSAMCGDIFFDIHFAHRPDRTMPFVYTRGRRRPWSQGAAPKVFLPSLPRPMLLRIFDAYEEEIVRGGMGATFNDFRKYLTKVRKEGVYFSRGELWEGVDGAAQVIRNLSGEPQASLALVGSTGQLDALGLDSVRGMLATAVQRIEAQLP